MNQKRKRKISFIIGLMVGVSADCCLRLISGDEGNLLVHSVFFLGSGLVASGVVYGFLFLWSTVFNIMRSKRGEAFP